MQATVFPHFVEPSIILKRSGLNIADSCFGYNAGLR
jgi:hypothetical protein